MMLDGDICSSLAMCKQKKVVNGQMNKKLTC
jgi:hypothetical protein